jgi:hypothetical protein
VKSCSALLCVPPWLCFLLQLGCRLAHILRRIMPISMYLLQKDGQCLSGHDLLLRRISSSFQDFIEEVGCAAVEIVHSASVDAKYPAARIGPPVAVPP